MPEDRIFLMGKFPAMLPGGLRYARNHMWCREGENGRARFGFTSYAIRLMQDVYFLDWQVSDGDRVELLQQIGHIETSKAVSDLFAPLAGTIAAFNPELLKIRPVSMWTGTAKVGCSTWTARARSFSAARSGSR